MRGCMCIPEAREQGIRRELSAGDLGSGTCARCGQVLLGLRCLLMALRLVLPGRLLALAKKPGGGGSWPGVRPVAT
jgi:hypothetical protein